MVVCCVPFCSSRSGKSKGIGFHDFPYDSCLQQKWLKLIPRDNFTPNTNSFSSVVCSLHFQASDYKPGLKKRCLKPLAVPTIFPKCPSYKVPQVKPPRKISIKKSSTSIHTSKVQDSIIYIQDGELRMKSKTVSGLNKVLSFSEKLGQWHLTEEQTDGTSVAETANCPVSIKTEKPDLEGNAAPTSLSNLPANSSFDSTTLKIMVPSTNMLVTVKKEPIDDLENSNNVSEDIIQKAPFTYEELEKHLEKICRPNSWWTVSSCPDYVICTKWNTSYASERKVAICKDLTTKVFLNNVRIFLDPKVSNFEGLSSLLRTVDEL